MRIRLEPTNDLGPTHQTTSGSSTSRIDTLASLGHLRRPPLMIFDPAGTDFGKHVTAPRIIRRAPLFCHHVTRARQIGWRLVVDTTGWIALDEMLDTPELCTRQMRRFAGCEESRHWREDTDVELLDEGGYNSARLDSPNFHIDGTTLSLLSAEPSNYGSWLFRILPKLALANAMGISYSKVSCWCPRPFQRELLQLFGIGAEQIVDILVSKCYEYNELLVPSCLNPEAYLNEMTLKFIDDFLKKNQIKRQRRRCLYISRTRHAESRGKKNVRYFVDEEALVERLGGAGFEILEPEKLSVLEQVKVFAEAAMVVGGSGAALFNTMFSEAGTVVLDIEAFPYWLHAHSNFFSSLGHNYIMAFGVADAADDSGPHQRWSIDVDQLAEFILDSRAMLVERRP